MALYNDCQLQIILGEKLDNMRQCCRELCAYSSLALTAAKMRLLCTLLLYLAIVEVKCSYPPTDGIPPPDIAHGFRIVFREAPWHAGIYTKTTKPYMQICGATVVAVNAVITAAHCFSKDRNMPSPSLFAVAAGKIYRPWNDPHDEGAQKYDVSEIRVPPRYQGSVANFQDDIAVVLLDGGFYYDAYVTPACLNFNAYFDEVQLRDGQLGKVVGWGLFGENSRASQVLQGATLPSVSIDKCIRESPAGFSSSITSDKICAGYNNGTAVCRGDSGGGLVFRAEVNRSSRVFLRGVVSTSPSSENSCNIYTWATFTHILKHEHFIKSIYHDFEMSCITKTSDPRISIRFEGLQIEHHLDNEQCSCTCHSS